MKHKGTQPSRLQFKDFVAKMPRVPHLCRVRSKRLRKDARGTVAIMAAFALPVLVLAVGGAVDYGRALDARTRLQTALDAAILATASHRMANPGLAKDELLTFLKARLQGEMERRSREYFDTNINDVSLHMQGMKLVATASGSIETPFLGIIGTQSLTVAARATVRSGFTQLEVALVLDVSSSMSKQGSSDETKLAELKEAAKAFLDTLHENLATPAEDGTAEDEEEVANTVRVAIVPFSQYVNVGLEMKNKWWLDYQPTSGEARKRLHVNGVRWKGCVGSRPYPWNLRDGKYMLYPIPTVMNYARTAGAPADDPASYTVDKEHYNRCPQKITPLTSVITDVEKLKQDIDSLGTIGWTYIPAGIIWGWRVLTSRGPFTEGATEEEVKARNIRRIIILMSDGRNTIAPGDDRTSPSSEHWLKDEKTANRYTEEACANVKKINPRTNRRRAEIITITFNLGQSKKDQEIRRIMQNCATMGSHDVKSGQLTSIFEQIANQITDMALTE